MVSFFAGSLENHPDIVRIDIEDLNLFWEIHLIVNKHAYLNSAATAFIEYACSMLL
jgi:hypothetical protein